MQKRRKCRRNFSSPGQAAAGSGTEETAERPAAGGGMKQV